MFISSVVFRDVEGSSAFRNAPQAIPSVDLATSSVIEGMNYTHKADASCQTTTVGEIGLSSQVRSK